MFNDTKKNFIRESLFLTALVFLGNVIAVEAASPKKIVKEGNLLYQKGDYAESKRKYSEALEKDPESDIINYNLGTSLYKGGQYELAIEHYQKVFLSDSDELKENAHYNLGNTLYKSGLSQDTGGDTTSAILSLEKSLQQYERALAISEDDDAKHNYDFVQKELQRLKVKQQQQQQQKQQGEKSDQSKDDQQQKDQSQQSQNEQKQEGQENQQKQDQQQGKDKEQQDKQAGQGEEQKDQQDKPDQKGNGTEGKEDDKPNNTSSKPQDASQLTPEEARIRLESYQQTEEPQRQFNVRKNIKDARPVSKDW